MTALIPRQRSRPMRKGNATNPRNPSAIATDRPALIRVLHLTLHRKWFDAIATGRKKHEFRAMTGYWERRFLTPTLARIFDEIHFRNGYHPALPFMRVEWKGLGVRAVGGQPLFAIKLGTVLEIRNWAGPV